MHEAKCPVCGVVAASGPNKASVEEHLVRHVAKAHPEDVAPKPKKPKKVKP